MAAASLQKKLSQIRRKLGGNKAQIRLELGSKLGAKIGVKNLGGKYLIKEPSLALDT